MIRVLLTFIIVISVVAMLLVGMAVYQERNADAGISEALDVADDAVIGSAHAIGKMMGTVVRSSDRRLVTSRDVSMKVAQESLELIEMKWRDLQDKVVSMSGEENPEFNMVKREMTKYIIEIKSKLVEAKGASDAVWEGSVRPSLEELLKRVRSYYEEMAARFIR